MQNAKIWTGMKIWTIFELYLLRMIKFTKFSVMRIDIAKMAKTLIKKREVLNYNHRKCVRYNPLCRKKQFFNCYKYGHVLVHY